MNNLPISSNTPQPSGNAANMLQDGLAMGAQPAGPFAFLLAQQIGATAQDAAQTVISVDGNVMDGDAEPATKDAQDQAAASTQGDPANMLAAILLQLSVEDKGQKTEGTEATPSFTLPPPKAEHKTPKMGSENSQMTQLLAIDPLSSAAVSRAESPSGPQSTPNTAQADVLPMAPAAMPETLTNNIPAGTTSTIATPLGKNGWANEFSQQIRWMATQQNQVAELHLNPPDLGPLDVVLKISDNQATALFASPHGAVRDAVENALPKLREILADNGIMLGNTTISDQSPRDRNMDEFMNQGSGSAAQQETSTPEPTGSSPAAAQTVPVRRHNGMVDTFA